MMAIDKMTDREFTEAFESCRLPNDQFHHRDHVRLAWIYVRSYGAADAAVRIAESIQRYAAYHGKSSKYDRELTVAWMRIVAEAVSRAPEASFEELLAAFPELLDKNTPASAADGR
jgi:hypothetical protein